MTYVCLLFIVFPAIASVETEDSQEASESTSLLQVGFGLQHQTPQQDSHRRYQVIRSSLDKVSSKVSCSATTTAHEIFQAHDFAGKVAIVTGADRGIGFAIASAFAQRSATVVIATQNRENGELAANSIAVSASNPNVFAIPLDLASFTSIRSFVSTFLDKNVVGGKLDFLVNNADTSATGITEDGFDVEFQAKYLGHFFITELLLPTLRNASSPRVINLASDSANFPCRQLGAPANCLNNFWFLSPKVVQNGSAHSLSEFLLIQHAAELASREGPKVKAFSVAPGPSSQAPEVAAAIIAFCAVASAGQICNGCFLHRNLNLLDSLPFPRPQYADFVSTFKTQECGVIALAMLASDGFTRDMRSELYERSRVISGLHILENRPRPTNAIRSPPFRHYLDAHPDVSKVDGDVLVKIWNAEGVGKYNVVWGPPGFSTLEWKAGSVTPYPAEKFWLPSSANFMLLEGSLSYELNGSIKTMSQGDVFWVAAFTRLGPFKPTSGANVTRLAQSGSNWIPSFTTHPKYMYADSIGPWGENWVGDVRFVEYNFSYWKTQMIQHDFEGATVFPPLEDASVRIPHDGLGAPGFTWTEGAEHVVWGHYHQCGTIYVPIVGKFCFGENSQGVILRDACLQPGEARWVRPGYYYDVEFFPGKYVGLTFTRSCGRPMGNIGRMKIVPGMNEWGILMANSTIEVNGRNLTFDDILYGYDLMFENLALFSHTMWFGVSVQQDPSDAFQLSSLIWKEQPDLLIEIGTNTGGGAIFYATVMREYNPDSLVLTIDPKDPALDWAANQQGCPACKDVRCTKIWHSKNVKYIHGYSSEPKVLAQVEQYVPRFKKVMVMHDGSHFYDHVLEDLNNYDRFTPVGSYMVVQDTKMTRMYTPFNKNPYPLGSVNAFMQGQGRGRYVIDKQYEYLLYSQHHNGWLRKMRP